MPAAERQPGDRAADARILLLLMAVVAVVYGVALNNGFLLNWDDPNYVVNNRDAHGFSIEHLRHAFSRFYVGNYAPLQIVSYMLDYQLWGLRPAGYIGHNLLLHGLNGWLLYLAIVRITARKQAALGAALLFLVHPLQVESVVWISQRKNLLAMLFFLLALLGYQAYRSRPDAKAGYWAALAFFGAALLAKSAAVVLPIGLLAYDRLVLGKSWRASGRSVLPFLLVAAGAGCLALVSQSAEFGGGGRAAYHGGSPLATALTMLPVFADYLRLLLLPVGLSGVYSPAIRQAVDPAVVLSAVALLLALAGAWRLCRRERSLGFWLLLGLAGFLPVSQVVPLVTLMNDRYLYFPLAGLAPFAVLGLEQAAAAWPANRRRLAVWGLLAVLAVFGLLAMARARVWQNALTLWSDAVAKDSANNGAAYNLANVFLETGQFDRARPYVEQLVRSQPNTARFQEMLGHYRYNTGDQDGAEQAYRRALALNPNLAAAQLCLGNIYLARRDLVAAAAAFAAAEQSGQLTADLAYSKACLLALQGEPEQALAMLETAFRLGFAGCEAVLINPELDGIRNSTEFTRILTTYCRQEGRK